MSGPSRFVPVLLLLVVLAAPAHADRRYFVQSYTPYLATAGSLDLEATTAAEYGQGDSVGTAFANHLELEYGITDRLTGAAYLNFVQDPGGATQFDGPSLEGIYRLTEPGRLPVDAALYAELRARGDELELEPKLLLARRIYRLVAVTNVIAEIERHYAGGERGVTEKNLRVTGGLTREIGQVVAIGVEAYWDRPGLGTDSKASAVFVGPTINLQTPRVQLALGWQQQVAGHPSTGAGLDLADFPRTSVRLIVGASL